MRQQEGELRGWGAGVKGGSARSMSARQCASAVLQCSARSRHCTASMLPAPGSLGESRMSQRHEIMMHWIIVIFTGWLQFLIRSLPSKSQIPMSKTLQFRPWQQEKIKGTPPFSCVWLWCCFALFDLVWFVCNLFWFGLIWFGFIWICSILFGLIWHTRGSLKCI